MKKLLLALLFALAYRKIHQDLEVRVARWGRSTTWISLDRDTVFAAVKVWDEAADNNANELEEFTLQEKLPRERW